MNLQKKINLTKSSNSTRRGFLGLPFSVETVRQIGAAGALGGIVSVIWVFLGPIAGILAGVIASQVIAPFATQLTSTSQQPTKIEWRGVLLGTGRIILFSLAIILGEIVISVMLQILGLRVEPDIKSIAPTFVMYTYGIAEVIMIVAIIGLFWGVFERRDWKGMGVSLQLPWGKHLFIGALMAFVMITLLFVIGILLGWVVVRGPNDVNIWKVINMSILLFIMAAREELLFRGYLLQSLERDAGIIVAIGISSFLYGLVHLGNPDVSLMAFIGIFLHGVFLCALLLATRSLWLTTGLHWMWNVALGVVYGLPVSGFGFERILQSQLVGSHWFYSPSGFGPEVGVLAMLFIFTLGLSGTMWLLRKI